MLPEWINRESLCPLRKNELLLSFHQKINEEDIKGAIPDFSKQARYGEVSYEDSEFLTM